MRDASYPLDHTGPLKVWQLLWQRWQNTACTTSRQTKKRISKRRHACWSPSKLCTWFKTLQSSEPSPLPAQQPKRIQPKQQSQGTMQIVAQDKQAVDMGLEYAKNVSLSKARYLSNIAAWRSRGPFTLYAFLTLLLPLQPNSQQTESEIRAAL